ncbi:hypothetical protein ACFX2F_003115 [Malus domestica]
MAEVGCGEASRLLALDHYNLGSLGCTNGKALRRAMESPRHLRRHSPLVHGGHPGQRASPDGLMLLVFDHTNTMVLHLGPIGPTILDLTAILGTSPTGILIDVALSGYLSNLNLKVLFDKRAFETLSGEGQIPSKEEVHKLHKNFFNYNTLYLHFAGRGEKTL